MKPRIYVETSVISYLAARPSRDPIQAARQLQASFFWMAKDRYSLVISPVVLDEASKGHGAQAAKRLKLLESLPVLDLLPEADHLANLLLERRALPARAVSDAAHIAIAAVHKVKAIASFNFRHIAGAFARQKIELTLRQLGYDPPIIATPEEIVGGIDE